MNTRERDKPIDQHLQDCIIYLIINDVKFLKKTYTILKPEYFSSKILYDIAEISLKYFRKFKKAPGDHFYDEFKVFINKNNIDKIERKTYVRYIRKINEMKEPNSKYVLSRINVFARTRDKEIALIKMAEAVKKGNIIEAENIWEKTKVITEEKKVSLEKVIQGYTNKKNLAEQFLEIQPLHYDKSGIWWLWDSLNYNWIMVDETDILNLISSHSSANTVKSVEKNEILESLRQMSRLKKPKDAKDSWIQFKDRIYDLNDIRFPKKVKIADLEDKRRYRKASSKYFITNPIDWELGNCEDTTEIDKLFESWVGKEHIIELYEVIAFCLIPKYFIHRIICLIGSGANGKSTFLNILRNFIGANNTVSTALDNLIGSSRFESSKLYKKLICLMGETNFNIMKRTELLKNLTGEDPVRGEIKHKNLLDFVNYAKIIMATNSLPMTEDITPGFFRRWKIIDFNSVFTKEKDVISGIPETEYNNLALKCLNILKRLWKKRTFTNDKNFEERRKIYEDKSNPMMKFINEKYIKNVNTEILLNEFSDDLNIYLEENGYRIYTNKLISKKLRAENYMVKVSTIKGVSGTYIFGIKKDKVNNKTIKRRKIKEKVKNLKIY